MPKLNTNHPEVVHYFTDVCRYWVEEWKIDGIRFDVGNEVAHSFLKKLHYEFKKINPELFLLGEIWHDSIMWLFEDEYDDVMKDVKQLIVLRRNYSQTKSNKIIWKQDTGNPRCIHYQKLDEKNQNILEIYLNASEEDVMVQNYGNILYSRNYSSQCLKKNGILTLQKKLDT